MTALRGAIADLHRWDESRGWPAFNAILARIDEALLDVDRLRAALDDAIAHAEAIGCRCPWCEERVRGWRVTRDPWLPTTDDVRGILITVGGPR